MTEFGGQHPDQGHVPYDEAVRRVNESLRLSNAVDNLRALVASELRKSIEIGPDITWAIFDTTSYSPQAEGAEDRKVLVAHIGPPLPEDGYGVTPNIRIVAETSMDEDSGISSVEDIFLDRDNRFNYRLDLSGPEDNPKIGDITYRPLLFDEKIGRGLWTSSSVRTPPPYDVISRKEGMFNRRVNLASFMHHDKPDDQEWALNQGTALMGEVGGTFPYATGHTKR